MTKKFAFSVALCATAIISGLVSREAHAGSKNAWLFAAGSGTWMALEEPHTYCLFKSADQLTMTTESLKKKGFSIGNKGASVTVDELERRNWRRVDEDCYAEAYFAWQGATMYAPGDGTYCGFANPQDLQDHDSRHPNVFHMAATSDPGAYMRYTGVCPRR